MNVESVLCEAGAYILLDEDNLGLAIKSGC
jgi:hypothetical protein